MKKIKIFTEVGSSIGLGHISRCSALYKEAVRRGFDSKIYLFGEKVDLTFLKNINAKYVDWINIEFLQKNLNSNDYCIVDSYLANRDILFFISNRVKEVIFIDDNNRLQYPKGIVINPSFDIGDIVYPNNIETRYYWGKDYIILRDVFINDCGYILKDRVSKVLVMMGGTDIKNITPIIIKEICNRYSDINFDVITTESKVEELKGFSKTNSGFYYNVDAEDIKTFMENVDFVITAAGQTIYELLRTTTPFIPVKVAENQNNNINSLCSYNLIDDYIDINHTEFISKMILSFEKMLKFSTRKRLNQRFKSLIDGRGAERIIDLLK